MKINVFWNQKDYKDLIYEPSYFRDPDQLDLWKSAGHNIDRTIIHISQIKNFNSVQEQFIKNFSKLSFIGLCFHKLVPGNYLPTHVDKYNFFIKDKNIIDPNKIFRYVVFLEDWSDGHILTVEDKVYTNWKAGDVVGWNGFTPHSAINLGFVDRYTLQVTGALLD